MKKILGFGGLIGDVLADFLLAPVYWYTEGGRAVIILFREQLLNFWLLFAVPVWVANIFVPMYGVRDWQSRLISVVMRLIQIVLRSLSLVVVVCMLSLALTFYFILPPFLFGALLFFGFGI